MKIHTLIVGGAAVLALAFANVTYASMSDLSTSLSSTFTSSDHSGGNDNGGNDNKGGNDNHGGGCDITPVPEATTLLPVVGLIAAVVASDVLRRRRAASLKQ